MKKLINPAPFFQRISIQAASRGVFKRCWIKKLLLTILIFPVFILLSSVFTEKALAVTCEENCTIIYKGSTCINARLDNGDTVQDALFICDSSHNTCIQNCSSSSSVAPTATPFPTLTPIPTSSVPPQQRRTRPVTTSGNAALDLCDKAARDVEQLCNQNCGGISDPDEYESCANQCGDSYLNSYQKCLEAPTPAPVTTSRLTWQEIAVCAAPIPSPTSGATVSTSTVTPVPTTKAGDSTAATPSPVAAVATPIKTELEQCEFKCLNPRKGQHIDTCCVKVCKGLTATIDVCLQSLTPTPIPCPSGSTCVKDGKNGTCNASGACIANQSTDNVFQCKPQVGTYAGDYKCEDIINSSIQCQQDYTQFYVGSPFTALSCGEQKGCCKKNPPVPTLAPTATPAPTIPSTNVTLVMALNTQDPTINDENVSANLSLYSLTTNTAVSGAPTSQSFAKTPIRSKKYSANISLTNLPPAKYFIVARKNNMIAKSVFEVKSATGIIEVPTTTLVFGDINNDDDISISDSSAFRACWKKPADGACARFDFNKSGKTIDQFDYNTLIQGFAIWNTQGK